MKQNIKLIPYLLINTISFYLLPIFAKETTSAILVMLIMLPIICFTTGIIYGMRHSFTWIYPLSISVLFAPTIFLFYNYTALIYIFGYGLISFIGILIGYKSKKGEGNEKL